MKVNEAIIDVEIAKAEFEGTYCRLSGYFTVVMPNYFTCKSV
jgi:hypothetical protein